MKAAKNTPLSRRIKTFEIEFSFSLIFTELLIGFRPFCWSMPRMCLTRQGFRGPPSPYTNHHLLIGPFHTWNFNGSKSLGFGVALGSVVFWGEQPSLPYNSKNIFGFKSEQSSDAGGVS